MAVIWLQTSVWHNRMILSYLLILIPLVVLASIFWFTYILHWEINEALWSDFTLIWWIGIVVLVLWMSIGIYFQKQILFTMTHARELQRTDNQKVYNIVENLCISKWLPSPKIWIIDSPWLNAYATWWDIKNSRIVFTKGLLENLDDKEIEAVAAHELSHIINGDVKNMIIVNIFIWAIATIWYYMMKMKSKNSKNNPLPLLGLILYLVAIIILPFIQFAISRKKEYLADAWSASLLQSWNYLVSALQKISKNSHIEEMDSKGSTLASMFIDNPKEAPRYFKSIRWLFSTHPPIEDRIAFLQKY